MVRPLRSAADTPLTLPGILPVSFSSGIQNTVAPSNDCADSTVVKLPLARGRGPGQRWTPGKASRRNSVAIRSGLPQPFFYETIFVTTTTIPITLGHATLSR